MIVKKHPKLWLLLAVSWAILLIFPLVTWPGMLVFSLIIGTGITAGFLTVIFGENGNKNQT